MKRFRTVCAIFIMLGSWIVTAHAQDEDTPTVTITEALEGVIQNGEFDVTITFSEEVSGFEKADITFREESVEASVTVLNSDDNVVYTATIEPDSVADGDVIIYVPENVAKPVGADPNAEDNNEASEDHTVKVDLVPPEVSIDAATLVTLTAFDVEITFTEAVSEFEMKDIALRGPVSASVTDLTTPAEGEDNHNIEYTATVTPDEATDTDGDIIFEVPADTAEDVAMNGNIASDSRTVRVDVTPPDVSITGVPTLEKNEAFDLTITFSEAVNGFQSDDITLTGSAAASLKSGSDGDSEYTLTITPDEDVEGDVEIQVPAGAVKDAAGNDNAASAVTDSVHIDTIPPTVQISDLPQQEKNAPFDITITFSEAVNGFQADDVDLTGPGTASLKSGSDGDTVYTATITPDTDAEGDVTFQVPAGAVKDEALNDNTQSAKHTVHVDTIPPIVEITSVPTLEKNEAFDIAITFSEAVNGFAVGDITLTGPATISLTADSDSDSEYTATITPNATSEGDVAFYVGANTVKDLALNTNDEPSNTPEVHVDTILPTVESITGIPTIEKNVPFDITITFSEGVNGFSAGDLTLTGPATASLKAGSDGDSVYTATITPDVNAEGDVTIQVPADVVKDEALNNNIASAVTDSVHIDTIPPTVEISNIPTDEKNIAFDITITFSEGVNGFAAGDLTLTGPATASLKSGSDGDSVYRATITPNTNAEGDVTLQVPADAVKDFARNDNTASNKPKVHVDTIPPTVAITGVPTIEKNVPFDITFTFSEAVNGFAVEDVTLTGPATVDLTAGGDGDRVYTAKITPKATSEGDVTFHIPAAIAQDFALNDSTASDSHTVHIDTILPKVESIAGVPVVEKNVPFDITITFSESINGFVAGDITLTGPATVDLTAGGDGDRVYTAKITPKATSEGDVTFHIPAAIAQDFALNDNTASDSHTVHIDTILPTAKITGVPTIEKNVAFDITITFSEAVNGFAVSDDLKVMGPAIASLKSGGDGATVYTATITPDANAEGDVTIQVPAGAVKDFARNDNTASERTKPAHIDTIRPTVAISNVPTIEKNVPFDITITFSEPVNGFAVSDIMLTGPAIVSLTTGSDGDSEYTAKITPDDDAEGDVEFQISAAATQDFALNANIVSERRTVHIDTIPPEVSITYIQGDTDVFAVVQLETFSLQIVFSEDVLEFEVEDIIFTGDAVVETSELTGSGSVYVLTITPHEDTDGNVIIEVPADVAEDRATNLNTASPSESVFVAPKWILDPNLRTVVREELGLDQGEDFAREQLSDLTVFNGYYRQINDITGLEYATRLTSAEFTGNFISDLTPLADLTTLVILILDNNTITNITSLENLTDLTTLNLAVNRIGNITPLENLTALETLNLSENLIDDLTPLGTLNALTHLYLTSNNIRDVSPLVRLKNLVVLEISGNSIENPELLAGIAKNVKAAEVVPSVIPDQALASAVRRALELGGTVPITIADLQRLTTLQVVSSDVRSLAGLEHAMSLTTLVISGSSITDITRLAGLTQLTTLNLDAGAITDITSFGELTSLTTLRLAGNAITDITSLEGLTSLTTLNLAGNAITDITSLEELTSLTTLNLSNNPIRNLEMLSGLTGLTTLELSGNSISDLNIISDFTALRTLNLSNNSITDITRLQNFKELNALDLSSNAISDLSSLAGLTQLTTLNLNNNTVSNLTALADLINLTTLKLAENAVSVLNPITTLRRLKVLDLNNNNSISTIDPLIALTQLTALDLSANNISDVKPLVRLVNLATLRLAGNPILDTTSLYPLTKRVPPVDIDITALRFPPWDVNQDGDVNAVDSALVTAALGQNGDAIVNPRTDVNADGTVDNADLTLVTDNLDAGGGAPSGTGLATLLEAKTLKKLDSATLEAQLDILRAESDGSPKYLRAIALLESILAAMRPDKTQLLANYPNPFNPETWIPYQLAKSSDVQLTIYNIRGVVVRRLDLGHQLAGYYTSRSRAVHWDGRNAVGERVASSIYFYQLQADNMSLLRKMVILK